MNTTNIISLVLIMAVFYFMIIRPQKKRQQSQAQMLESLRTGDKVITIGGINGTIVAIDSETVIIATGDNEETTLVMSKPAISQVVEGGSELIAANTDTQDEEEFEDEDEDDEEYEDDEDYEDDEEEVEEDKTSK